MKMERLSVVLTILALSLTITVDAQMNLERFDSTECNHEIIVGGVLDYSATSIENSIFSRFIFGGKIEDDVKASSFERHRSINRVGVDAGGEINYRNYNLHLWKNENWGMQFNAGYHTFGGAIYSDDFFGLAFYGNDRYVGDTAVMSGMDISMVSYQKIGFGIINKKTKTNFNFNIYNINNRISGDFRDLELRQSESGDEVVVVMDGDVELSNDSSFNRGIGFGFDVDYRVSVDWYKDRKAKLQFLAKNVGVGYMYKPQQRYSFDTTITYTGFQFSDLVGDDAIFNDSLDILDTLGIKSSEVNPVFILPGFLQVGKMVDQNSPYDLQAFFGVRVYPTLIFAPYAFAGMDYRVTDWFNAGVSVGYGGFAGIRAGLYTNFKWEKLAIGLGSDNLSGMIRKKGNGGSLYLKLACRL